MGLPILPVGEIRPLSCPPIFMAGWRTGSGYCCVQFRPLLSTVLPTIPAKLTFDCQNPPLERHTHAYRHIGGRSPVGEYPGIFHFKKKRDADLHIRTNPNIHGCLAALCV